jgi:hypothetical protein
MAANYSSCARAHHLLSVIALLAVAGYAAAASGSPHGGRSVVTVGKKSAVLPLRELKWFAAARKIRGRYAQPSADLPSLLPGRLPGLLPRSTLAISNFVRRNSLSRRSVPGLETEKSWAMPHVSISLGLYLG